MAKTLRETDHDQFTNKNAELTNSEVDATFIGLQEEINTANGLSQVDAYDAAKSYQLNEFASYEFLIYKAISNTPFSAITPGTDDTKWAISSLAEFIHTINFIVVTKAELDALVAASTIKRGRWYYVSDSATFNAFGFRYFGLGVSSNKIARSTFLESYVPDFQVVGDYSSVTAYDQQLGLWKSTRGTLNYLGTDSFAAGQIITGTSGATAVVVSDTPIASPAGGTLSLKDIVGTFSNGNTITGSGASPIETGTVDGAVTYTFNPQIGDVVIWDGRHYRKKTNTITSTSPDADGTNYELLAFDLTNGYILEVDSIIGNWDTFDQIKRIDKRGNEVFNPMQFQWGNDLVTNNFCHAGVTLNMRNYYGTMEDMVFKGSQTLVLDESEENYSGQEYNVDELEFEGLITQGAGAPTLTILKNTLGTVTPLYTSTGEYKIQKSNAFTNLKTTVLIGSAGSGANDIIQAWRGDVSNINILTAVRILTGAGYTLTNGILNQTSILIKVKTN